MKIAFPTQKPDGLDSVVYGHFGSAAAFVIVNTKTDEVYSVANKDANHPHGQCQPLKALGGEAVNGVVTGGIGGGALHRLNVTGVTVYRAVEGTVADNIELVKEGKLPEIRMNQTCGGHGPGGGCTH